MSGVVFTRTQSPPTLSPTPKHTTCAAALQQTYQTNCCGLQPYSNNHTYQNPALSPIDYLIILKKHQKRLDICLRYWYNDSVVFK